MHSLLLRITIIYILILSSLNILADDNARYYRKWMNLSSEKLMEMGDQYYNVKHSNDSALVCYSMVVNRYNKNMTAEEKKLCFDASLGQVSIYFLFYFDYHKMYESLIKASEISKDLKLESPEVDYNFGFLYNTLSEQIKDKELNEKARSHFSKALSLAIKEGDRHKAGIIMGNLMITGYVNHTIEKIDVNWQLYEKLIYEEDDYIHVYNKNLYYLIEAVDNKDYDKALVYSDSLISCVEKDTKLVRFKCAALCIKARVCSMKGDLPKSIEILKTAETLSEKYKLKDGKLEIYEDIALCYERLKDQTMSMEYKDKYLRLKDTLLNYRQLKIVNEMPFVNEIHNMEKEMDNIRQRNEIKDIVFSLVAVLFAFLILFAIYIYRKNRQLAELNRTLYFNYTKMIKAEEERLTKLNAYKLLLEQYEMQYKDGKDKYANSQLHDDYKSSLLEKVVNVMENIEEISSPTFSSERLAELIGEQYKYISQVINGEFGCNFNTLLNQYRVKEICRRLSDDKNYGKYTTEAIGESLGFKSRSNFISTFKKITGLTPLQYRKIALKEAQ